MTGVVGLHRVGTGPVGGGLVLKDVFYAELVALQSLAMAQM